jgi:hypothetical protein
MPQTSPASVFFADAPYRSVFAPCLAVKRKGRCPVTEASQGVQVAERYESPKHVRDHVRRKKFRTFSNWFAQRLFPQRGEKNWEGACRLGSITPPRAQSTRACDPRSTSKEAGAKCPCLFGAAIGALEDTCGRLAPGTMAELLCRFLCRSA